MPRLLAAIPWIACRSVRETIAFYETKLGFTTEWTWGDPPTDAGVRRGDARMYLFANPDLAGRIGDSEITLVVDDVDALYAEHRERGAPIAMTIRDEPWGSREYHVRDPAGYLLRFSGERVQSRSPGGSHE